MGVVSPQNFVSKLFVVGSWLARPFAVLLWSASRFRSLHDKLHIKLKISRLMDNLMVPPVMIFFESLRFKRVPVHNRWISAFVFTREPLCRSQFGGGLFFRSEKFYSEH